MPKVIVEYGGKQWAVDLREGVNIVGRSPQAAIAIKDASMSREHCEIRLAGGVATVVDRGSMNGTLLNGSRVDRRDLSPGDRIQIGKASIFFEEKRAGSDSSKIRPAAVRPPETEDFAVWRRETGGGARIAAGVAALLVIGAGAVFGFRALSRGEERPTDPENLLGLAGRFESATEKGVLGWAVKPGLASEVKLSEGSPREGKFALQLEKSGAPNDLVAEVSYQDTLELPRPAPVEFSAWVRADAPGLLVALKMTWLTSRKGLVLAEECMDPGSGSTDWSRVSHTFQPPPGAGYFQPCLVAAGRGGRVYFDDARLRILEAPSASKPAELGTYTLAVSGTSGNLAISHAARRVLGNLHLTLATDKEGTLPQSLASGVQVMLEGQTLSASGRFPSPVDLRPIEFSLEARADAAQLVLGYRLKGDSLKQVDRIGLSAVLPAGELFGEYSNPVSRCAFRCDAGDFVLELVNGLMTVSAERFPGARRLIITIPEARGSGEVAFSFILKAGGGGQLDPAAEVKKAISEGRMGLAMSILRQLLAVTREEDKRQDLVSQIRNLDQMEGRDWNGVMSAGFRAELIGRRSFFEAALQQLDLFEKRWAEGRFAPAARTTRDKLTAGLAKAAGDRDTERAARIMQQAEDCKKGGQKELARALADSVRRQYPNTPSAEKAAEFLKTLGSE
jgi:hypothetical protein